jgi:hypothetical protein
VLTRHGPLGKRAERDLPDGVCAGVSGSSMRHQHHIETT